MTPADIHAAYQFCQEMADSHYENFPVASKLLPKNLRKHVSAIYAFARNADDYADEGTLDTVTRLAKLDECDHRIKEIGLGNSVDDPIYIALADTIHSFSLPASLFHDLVSAFRQDVTTHRYANFTDVLDYCRRSANPVGRLLLHLLNRSDKENCRHSDNICSALQLINFYQDIQQDYRENNRIYLPADEMAAAGISEEDIVDRRNDARLHDFMHSQYRRAAEMLCSGLPLTKKLGTRMNLEIRATIYGGLRILEQLLKTEDVFSRPRLSRLDIFSILLSSFLPDKACQRYTTPIK
jgi:squalene synthase HpnC